jgi:hypothetical protein
VKPVLAYTGFVLARLLPDSIAALPPLPQAP